MTHTEYTCDNCGKMYYERQASVSLVGILYGTNYVNLDICYECSVRLWDAVKLVFPKVELNYLPKPFPPL